ncbi:TPA: hypothetical protein QDC06_004054 [Burkholderia cepacia]|nr:hypothetical protein [Burkholderia cepacia]
MTLHGCTRSARGRRTIFQPLVISVHAARHAAHSRDERIVACRLPPGGTREADGIQHAAAAEALRCDVGSGAADGVQSSMHPAKTLAQFHCLERRLYEAIPPSGKVTRHFITNYYRCRRVSFPTISLPDARA